LLAQAVLRGQTRGYRHHPQLLRFKMRSSPVAAIAEYLRVVHAESTRRDYSFEAAKIHHARDSGFMTVTRGQLQYEWNRLMAKLEARDPEWKGQLSGVKRPAPHPLFRVVPGDIEAWERPTFREE
jgi:hypothetical protein